MATLTANAITPIYGPCPAGKDATKSVRFTHTGINAGTIRLYKSTAATQASVNPGDALVYERKVAPTEEVEVTSIYCAAGDYLYARVSDAAISVNAYGPEELI